MTNVKFDWKLLDACYTHICRCRSAVETSWIALEAFEDGETGQYKHLHEFDMSGFDSNYDVIARPKAKFSWDYIGTQFQYLVKENFNGNIKWFICANKPRILDGGAVLWCSSLSTIRLLTEFDMSELDVKTKSFIIERHNNVNDNESFNFAEAKAGKPVMTQEGYPVRLLDFNISNKKPILGIVSDGEDKPELFDKNGISSNYRLVMATPQKEGYIVMLPDSEQIALNGKIFPDRNSAALQADNLKDTHYKIISIDY